MGKSVKITPPDGYELDEKNSTSDNIVFKKEEPNGCLVYFWTIVILFAIGGLCYFYSIIG